MTTINHLCEDDLSDRFTAGELLRMRDAQPRGTAAWLRYNAAAEAREDRDRWERVLRREFSPPDPREGLIAGVVIVGAASALVFLSAAGLLAWLIL